MLSPSMMRFSESLSGPILLVIAVAVFSLSLDNIQDPNGLARVIRSAIDMLNDT
jgi:hypothetical protein